MINVSIVLYHTPIAEVKTIVDSLRTNKSINEIWLIDNSEIITEAFMFFPATYIFNNKNLGYGKAHNIALRKSLNSDIKYHLVINSDITLDSKIIDELCTYLDNNEDCGLIMPKILNPDGSTQHLCKLIPSPYDLIARRFLPKCLTKKRTAKFKLHHTGYNKIMNVPYLSGCFMLIRVEALKNVGIFDERFFMYPEDIDLSRRINHKYKTIFYPNVSAIHSHGKASYKNIKMLWIHSINICKYFNKWGWICDTKRKLTNIETLKNLY